MSNQYKAAVRASSQRISQSVTRTLKVVIWLYTGVFRVNIPALEC